MSSPLGLCRLAQADQPSQVRSLDSLQESHGTAPRAARMYSRFFGQERVLIHPAAHRVMLTDALRVLLRDEPQLRQRQGLLLYAKTQTHNTPADQRWLTGILTDCGLTGWEAATISMTNCASALAAMHLYGQGDGPVIVLAGEKAFHAFGARLSVGLLGEAPVAALFGTGGRAIALSDVRHLPRFHLNPDDMAEAERHAFQTEFEAGFVGFLRGLAQNHAAFMAKAPVLVPYNLNLPLLLRVLDAAGFSHLRIEGHSGADGHCFCSDPFLNLARLPVPHDRPLLLISAGMGVTFAALGLGPGLLSATQPQKQEI